MGKSKSKSVAHIHYHRDGSIWARGEMSAAGVMSGYWEWYRKDGTKMRSGYFENGEQAGEWVTYDRKGKVVKATQMKGKATGKTAVKKKPVTKKSTKKSPVKKKAAKRRAEGN